MDTDGHRYPESRELKYGKGFTEGNGGNEAPETREMDRNAITFFWNASGVWARMGETI